VPPVGDSIKESLRTESADEGSRVWVLDVAKVGMSLAEKDWGIRACCAGKLGELGFGWAKGGTGLRGFDGSIVFTDMLPPSEVVGDAGAAVLGNERLFDVRLDLGVVPQYRSILILVSIWCQ
jgi:hypothetical protein